MDFHTRCRYWFILQVVAIIVCYRGKASCSTKISKGCVGSRHDLECPPIKVISVKDIYRGISSCNGASCCIEESGCSQQLKESYTESVHSRCDDKQKCSLDIDFAKIPCTSGWWWGRTTIDGYAYERITYICRDDPQVLSTVTTPSNSVRPVSSDGIILYTAEQLTSGVTTKDNVTTSVETHMKRYESNPEEEDESEGGHMEDAANSKIATVVMVIIGLILLIETVVIVVVMYRRRQRLKSSIKDKSSDDKQDRNEFIYTTEAQGASQNENAGFPRSVDNGSRNDESLASDYCELETTRDRQTAGKDQTTFEGAYEHLDNKRNYEPLNFYEQLQ